VARADNVPETRSISGIVLVDKPSGLTSNRVLQRVRRLFGARKAGHTGTLDPMATGMLPICLGSATRVSGLMLDASKRYRVRARFGIATDTGDATGQVTGRVEREAPASAEIDRALAALRGSIQQVPPMYSAVKHEGRRLYELARRGQEVPRQAREVQIYELVLETLDWPQATLRVHCSKGTYVRTLVTDLGASLGNLAHVTALRRLAVGPFGEDRLVALATLEAAATEGLAALDRWLLGVDAALVDIPAVRVSDDDGVALRQGRRIVVPPRDVPASVRIYDGQGHFVGLGHLAESGELKPARIFDL
jgi:tRNA pseudouridine55 synthase